jgi:hypothetical protein
MKKITLLVALLITSAVVYGQSLISNGDFESLAAAALPGDATTLDIWTSGSGGVNVQDNALNSYEGTKYINMGNDFRNLRQFFTATASTVYTVTFRYRNNFADVATTDAPFVSVRINDGESSGNGTIIESIQLEPFFNDDLTIYKEQTFTFNSGIHTNLSFYIFKEARVSSSNLNNAARIDAISIVESATASANDFSKFGFKSHPNPVNDVLNFRATKSIQKVEIFNLLGQRVLEKSNVNKNEGVHVAGLKRGVYTVKIRIEDAVSSYKIVKN